MRGGSAWPLLAALALAACAEPPPMPAVDPARHPLALDRPVELRGPAQAALAEPAPVPNREIEAPPDRLSDPLAPRIEPMVLRQDRPQGMTFGSEHIREASPDRSLENLIPGMGLPLNDVLPGARVRIPFE
jgi:hypothetical protein